MTTVTIIGASGFLGRHLIEALLRRDCYEVRLLVREPVREPQPRDGVVLVTGDLDQPESLDGLLTPGCTVVNLAYLWHAGHAANLNISIHLATACARTRIARLIHVSTAAVVGRVPDDRITEVTHCQPTSEYGITKLDVENYFRAAAVDNFDLAVVRPTSVFGPKGAPLEKLAHDLVSAGGLKNYLKSSLFGRRAMNLVHIDNVVAALLFLIDHPLPLQGESFIVSDDAAPTNNFRDVEHCLMRVLDIPPYAVPQLPIPTWLMRAVLRVLGRNNINPLCRFRQDKLEGLGFSSPMTFDRGLVEYAEWFRRTNAKKPAAGN